MFTQMSPCVSSATPTDPPKNKQQLHILLESGATGHPTRAYHQRAGRSPRRPVEHDVRSGPVSSPPELRLF